MHDGIGPLCGSFHVAGPLCGSLRVAFHIHIKRCGGQRYGVLAPACPAPAARTTTLLSAPTKRNKKKDCRLLITKSERNSTFGLHEQADLIEF